MSGAHLKAPPIPTPGMAGGTLRTEPSDDSREGLIRALLHDAWLSAVTPQPLGVNFQSAWTLTR